MGLELVKPSETPLQVLRRLPPELQNILMQQATEKAQANISVKQEKTRYHHYAEDPVGFTNQVLGATVHSDLQAVMESVRDNEITVARSSTGTGKTFSAAHIAVWWYKCYSGAQVYTTAAPPLDNLRKLLWGEIGSITEHYPEIFMDDQILSMEIRRNSKEFITAVTIPTTGSEAQRESKFSGKHAAHLLFIVDEGDAVPDEVYKGIEGCMSGGIKPRLLVMFNPRARMGRVWTMERDRQARVVTLSSLNHPNVLTGDNAVPGAVTRQVTVQRINEWTRPLVEGEKIAEDKAFIVPEYLVGATAKAKDGREYPPLPATERVITEPSFSYMVLGEYPAQGATQLIAMDWIRRARNNYDFHISRFGEKPPRGISPILGADIAEFGTDFNAVVLRYGSYVRFPFTWTGIDTHETAQKILGIAVEESAQSLYIDGSGVGASVAPYIAKTAKERQVNLRAFSIKVQTSPSVLFKSELGDFYQLRDQLWWTMREWLRTNENAMLPPDEMLLEELSIPTYSLPGGKIKVMMKDEMRLIIRRSPDRAEALMMTFNFQKRAKVVSLGSMYETN